MTAMRPSTSIAGRNFSFQYYKSLVAMLAPGFLFAVFLAFLSTLPRFAWVGDPLRWPWEIGIIALAGSLATLGGIMDWRFHRKQGVKLGLNERKAEFLALATGGVPLFLLMATASVIEDPRHLLIPIIAVVLYTTHLICYDEFVYHRKRCGPYETRLHRVLVLGNAVAWLAWMHLCFVRGGMHAVTL